MLMARAEAAAPRGGGAPLSEAEKLKRALMLALLDKQVGSGDDNDSKGIDFCL